MIVNDLLEEPTMPSTFVLKLIGAGIAVLALVALIWSWQSRGQQIETLEDWQDTVVESATLATVEPDENGKRDRLAPEDVPAAIAALAASLQSADSTLDSISQGTMTAKAASDAADRALNRDLERLRETFETTDVNAWDPWAGAPLVLEPPVRP